MSDSGATRKTGDRPKTWEDVLSLAARVGARLANRKETVAVAESSAGGLISAALLAVPGASAYFRGGGVVYTLDAKSRLLGSSREEMSEPRAATEAHALVLARAARRQLDATWGIGETGASGPTGNRYGDPPGHACLGVAGPDGVERAVRVGTGTAARLENMYAFAHAALGLLEAQLG
ncbi:MAG TPA: CinA family protein [Chloroflexota bacterium]|nr:CinA family protein [Chloroflexota bacterium]